jgi:hypothetical protein
VGRMFPSIEKAPPARSALLTLGLIFFLFIVILEVLMIRHSLSLPMDLWIGSEVPE